MRTVILILLINFASNAWANNVITGSANGRLEGEVVSEFNSPWAMSFINSDNLLVTTKTGKLWLVNTNGEQSLVSGVPKVFAGGQGGLGDVVLHPNYEKNNLVYISYIDSDDAGKTRYASVIRGTLENSDKPQLKNIETIWKQTPAQSGKGHFSHRIAFGLDGTQHAGKIFITSGDRQEQTPAQQWDMALGNIIRLNEDGTIPTDNPFQDRGDLAKTFGTPDTKDCSPLVFTSQSFPAFVVTSRLSLLMKDIAQGPSNSETTSPSNLLPALPVTTLLAQAFEAKFINNISITVRIYYLSHTSYFSQTLQAEFCIMYRPKSAPFMPQYPTRRSYVFAPNGG